MYVARSNVAMTAYMTTGIRSNVVMTTTTGNRNDVPVTMTSG